MIKGRNDLQGSVAKSTHAGIPWLRFIRQRLRDRVHFWPFDGWDIPAGRSAVVEVYPSLVTPSTSRVLLLAAGEIEDIFPDDGKDPAAKALGKKGGAARAKVMAPERRGDCDKRPLRNSGSDRGACDRSLRDLHLRYRLPISESNGTEN